tara:strand:+ start:3316 stop:4344 length:1029 start_codon:yes stop_codon:yes gene_type:complete
MILKNKILKKIKDNSFIYLDDFMQISLSDENNGYYTVKQPIGKDGDFITAPEISQLFGEMTALSIIQQLKKKSIDNFNLIELGPGKGTLMQDVTRTLNKVMGDENSYKIHFLEINKYFKDELKIKFKNSKFHKSISTFPKGYSIILANEFFDALPIIQIHNLNNRYYETAITAENDNIKFTKEVLRKENQDLFLKETTIKSGKLKEFSPASNSIFTHIINYLKTSNGMMLIMDYGYINDQSTSTLQSIKNNKKTNFLENIGEQDLTSHINFNMFINILKKNQITDFQLDAQRKFLLDNGITFRATQLIDHNPKLKKEISGELSRLIDIDKMGNLFKVLKFEV